MDAGSLVGPLVAELAAAFPRQPVTRETLDVYKRELSDLPPNHLAAAVRALIRTEDWMPTVHKVRETAVELALALPGETEALAQVEAMTRWARTDESERGAAPGVHPLVMEAIAAVGGFYSFRTSDEPTVVRGQFGRFYRDLRSNRVRTTNLSTMALPAG